MNSLRQVIIFPMTLSLQEVEHIANLARLRLSEEEKKRFRGQLEAILEYAASLEALDVSQAPPTTSALEPAEDRPLISKRPLVSKRPLISKRPLRSDEPRPGLDLPALLANAPDVAEEQFRVPPVLE